MTIIKKNKHINACPMPLLRPLSLEPSSLASRPRPALALPTFLLLSRSVPALAFLQYLVHENGTRGHLSRH
jgi:hypothetical protein